MKRNIKFEWTVPFRKVEEGESYGNCIVAYCKTPIEFNYINHGDKSEEIATKWRRKIYINLYLVQIKIKI